MENIRFASFSNSRSNSTSMSWKSRPLTGGLSFQHMSLAKIANSVGSMVLRSSRAYAAKKGNNLTIRDMPIVHTVDEQSKNSEYCKLRIRGSFGRILAAEGKEGAVVKIFNSENS